MSSEFVFDRFDDAQGCAMYLEDRGYEARLLGLRVIVDSPVDTPDLLVIKSVYSGSYKECMEPA